uniref:PITH domain-containing protein n=1 Tax=Meloidogyne javanica TaxID=6303 RepID=A0A915MAI5_MELJA
MLANVKLTGITFSGPLSGSFPSTVRLFKDRGNMSFDDCENAKEDQQIELKQDSDASIDYPLMSSKFNSVGHLTLYFPANFGDEKTIIYYIGLRGEFQSEFRNKIVIATYEARPVPDDHKAGLRDMFKRRQRLLIRFSDNPNLSAERKRSMEHANKHHFLNTIGIAGVSSFASS